MVLGDVFGFAAAEQPGGEGTSQVGRSRRLGVAVLLVFVVGRGQSGQRAHLGVGDWASLERVRGRDSVPRSRPMRIHSLAVHGSTSAMIANQWAAVGEPVTIQSGESANSAANVTSS